METAQKTIWSLYLPRMVPRINAVRRRGWATFNQRTTPEVKGTVSRIGADLTKETQTNTVFYTVRIRALESEADRLRLVPGMPVEAFIATGERTAISYLVKPVSDQFVRAFRER